MAAVRRTKNGSSQKVSASRARHRGVQGRGSTSTGTMPPSLTDMGRLPVDAEMRASHTDRSIVAIFSLTSLFLMASSTLHADSLLGASASLLGGFVAADAVSGIFHWSVDNYGTDNHPVFGSVIDAFQGHHKWPYIIASRDPCNNLSSVSKAGTLLCVLLWLAPLPPSAALFACSTVTFSSLSQQFHAWSHTKPSSLPPAVKALQSSNILIGCGEHGVHHKSPHAIRYSIVSGWTNPVFDQLGIFRRLERLIVWLGGPAPRCWAHA